jgi:hypothetical protein
VRSVWLTSEKQEIWEGRILDFNSFGLKKKKRNFIWGIHFSLGV